MVLCHKAWESRSLPSLIYKLFSFSRINLLKKTYSFLLKLQKYPQIKKLLTGFVIAKECNECGNPGFECYTGFFRRDAPLNDGSPGVIAKNAKHFVAIQVLNVILDSFVALETLL